MEAKRRRLTLDVDSGFQRRLKAVAALKGVSMRRYCQAAIERELTKDEANGVLGQPIGHFDIEGLITTRKEMFGDKVFSGDGAELIREARAIREAQLKDVM